MKRKITAILLTGIMIASMTACRKDQKVHNSIQEQPELNQEENDEINESSESQPEEFSEALVNEPVGMNYHRTVKISGDEVFYSYLQGIVRVNLKTNETKKIVTLSGNQYVSSFCLYQGNVYFITDDYDENENCSWLSRVSIDGSDSCLLKEVMLGAICTVYNDILYINSFDEHSCYRINESGDITGPLLDGETYYSLVANLDTSDLANGSNMLSIGECLNRYEGTAVWVNTENGNVRKVISSDGSSKEFVIHEGQSVVAIAEPYLITVVYDDITKYYLWNMETDSGDLWFQGNVDYLDVDENGAYFSVYKQETDQHQYVYVRWDGSTEFLFEVTSVNGMRDTTVGDVSNFSVIDGRIYYLFGYADGMYLMYRELDSIDEVHLVGDAYDQRDYPKYGHIDYEYQTVKSTMFPEKDLIEISYEQLVFDGGDEASEKMNAMFSEIKETNIKSEMDFATEFEDSLEEDLFNYYYHSYITGFTYQSDEYLSISQSENVYTGGNHGMLIRNYYLMDLQIGKRLLLEDIVENTEEELKDIVTSYFKKMYDKNPDTYWEDSIQIVHDSVGYSQQFYVTKEGIVFYFSPYEVSSYAAGFREVLIPYDALKMKIELL